MHACHADSVKKLKMSDHPVCAREPSVDDLLQQLTSSKRAVEEASSDEEEDTKKFKVEEEGVDDAK